MRRLTAALLAAAASVAVPAAAADFRLLELDGAHVKWGAAELRTGADVTWGFATAERSFPDAINCGELAPIAELEAAWGADPARLVRVVEAAFAMWSREADLQFRPARAGEAPDILIGAQGRPERIAFANVWHAAPAPGGAIAAADPRHHLLQSGAELEHQPRCRRRAASTSAPCSPTRSATRSGSTIRARPER